MSERVLQGRVSYETRTLLEHLGVLLQHSIARLQTNQSPFTPSALAPLKTTSSARRHIMSLTPIVSRPQNIRRLLTALGVVVPTRPAQLSSDLSTDANLASPARSPVSGLLVTRQYLRRC